MRWLVLSFLVACSSTKQPAPTKPTSGSAKCDCMAACDCYGVDDERRHARRAKAVETCVAANVDCKCGECNAR